MKAIRLRDPSLDFFRARLRGSLGSGQYAAPHVREGELRVWAPEALPSVDLRKADVDIFYPEPFDVEPAIKEMLQGFLARGKQNLVIADTSYKTNDAKPGGLEWFSVDDANEPAITRCCAFVRGGVDLDGALHDLLAAASSYPTTLVLTSTETPPTVFSEAHLMAPAIGELVSRLGHVLVGVFDERSMLVWSRNEVQGEKLTL